jgi:hypothetical protein
MFYAELTQGLSLFVDGSTCRSGVGNDTPLAGCIRHICDGSLVKGKQVWIPSSLVGCWSVMEMAFKTIFVAQGDFQITPQEVCVNRSVTHGLAHPALALARACR